MGELLDRHRAVMPNWLALYYQEPIEIVHGSGRRVTDADGVSYLDFFAGILTNGLGYDVAEVADAVRKQLSTGITHTSTLYLIRSQVELAERIAARSGIADAKVFFTNSGTEANETAMMLATTYRRSNQVLAMRNSYHGRAFATVGTTGNRGWSASSLTPVNVSYLQGGYPYRSPYAGLSEADYIAACVADLRDVLATTTSGDVACLIAEPIQGVGGFATPPDGLYGAYAEVLREHGILFISDEVQTGWGRTGEHFWGIQAHDVLPDAMTFAKALGNGLAIGGLVARPDLMDCLRANSISTFGGNPVATAGANAVLDYIENHDLQQNAAVRGNELLQGLRSLAETRPAIGDVRGKGLMIGVELVKPGASAGSHSGQPGQPGQTGQSARAGHSGLRSGLVAAPEPDPDAASRLMEQAKRNGLLIGKGGLHGNVLRIAPPLTVTAEEVAEALEMLTEAADQAL